jgi:hypothetical protein
MGRHCRRFEKLPIDHPHGVGVQRVDFQLLRSARAIGGLTRPQNRDSGAWTWPFRKVPATSKTVGLAYRRNGSAGDAVGGSLGVPDAGGAYG